MRAPIGLFLALLLSACQGIEVSDDARTGGSAPDDDGGTDGDSDDAIRIEECQYSDWMCLVTERALLSGSPSQAALVGVYYGNPNVNFDDLVVDDLHAHDFREDAAIGWATTCSSTDIGHATSARDDVFEWPLGSINLEQGIEPEVPSGVYRLALRKLNAQYDDLVQSLQVVTCENLADPDEDENWSVLLRDWLGVWCGNDEDGNTDICSIVVGYDADNDEFDLGWADRLPDNLEEIDN